MQTRHVLAALAIAANTAVFAADGAALAMQHCTRCHGNDGLSTAAGTPYLNAQLASYLAYASTKLQNGKRPSKVPNHVPPDLGADEVTALAAYYAGLPAGRPKQETDPAKVTHGKAIHGERCIDCHLDNGRDADKDAPLMAGQDLAYLIEQSRLFMSGKRPFGFLQDEAFKGLGHDDLEAVAHFFAAQDPVAPRMPSRKRR